MTTPENQEPKETFETSLKEENPSPSPIQISSPSTQSPEKGHGQIISLLNFDPSSRRRKFLNSPRSMEAMKRLCFEDDELLMKRKEDFIGISVPTEFADDKNYFYEVKVEHYEKRRKEKLKLAINEREEIINGSRGSPMHSASGHGSPGMENEKNLNSTFNSTTFFGQERKKIQQMKNQQKKEIDMIIQNELKVQDMQRKNEEKLQRMRELEERRQSIIEQKQRMAEDGKRKRELQKLEKEKEDEVAKEALIERQKLEEMKRAEVQERLREERSLEAIHKEKERKEKNFVREKKIEQIEVSKKVETEKKIEEREQRFSRIRQEIDDKQKRKQIQSELSRRNFDVKIDAVRKRFEVEKEEQRKRVLEKQKITESRRERFEEDKHQELDQRRNRSEIKIREIKCSLDEKFLQEQTKKMSYLVRYQKAEENKKQKDFELEFERKSRAQKETEKEERARLLVTEFEQEKLIKSSNLLKTLNEKSVDAQIRKESNIKNLKKKYIMDILKMEDAYENTKRLEKMRENKTKAFMEKITTNAQRLQQIQAEKEKAILEKKKLQTQLEMEKEIVLKDFEKKKKLLATNRTIVSELSMDLKNEGPFIQTSYGTNLSSKTNQKHPVLSEVKSASRSAKNVRGGNLTTLQRPGHESNSASLSLTNNSFLMRDHHNSSASPQIIVRKRGSVTKDVVIKVKSDVLKKQDVLPTDIQNQEYNKQSTQLRNDQLLSFLKVIDNAVKGDGEEKKIESSMRDLISCSQREEEDVSRLRLKTNFLLLS